MKVDSTVSSGRRAGILLLCMLSMIVDGYDMQIMGYVAPSLLLEWQVPRTALTPVFSAGVIGMLVGSLLCGHVSDRYGRRRVLLLAMIWITAAMLAVVGAGSLSQLAVLRFLGGIGMGAVVPNAVALGGEFSAARHRATTMMTITCGYLIGALLCGVVTSGLVSQFGWQAVFVAGGATSLLLAVLIAVALPESPQFLAMRAARSAGSGRALTAAPPRASVGALFEPPFLVATLLLWSAYFLNLLAVFFFSSWLPVLTSDTGHTANQAIVAGTALWAGGIAGTLSLGWAIDRYGFGRVVASVYLLATVGIVATGWLLRVFPLALVAILVVGFCIMGAQAALNAFAATLYPTSVRTTGMGWALGIGRFGSIVGPIVGGQLIGLRLPPETLFAVAAIPTALAMLVVLPMRHRDTMQPDHAEVVRAS